MHCYYYYVLYEDRYCYNTEYRSNTNLLLFHQQGQFPATCFHLILDNSSAPLNNNNNKNQHRHDNKTPTNNKPHFSPSSPYPHHHHLIIIISPHHHRSKRHSMSALTTATDTHLAALTRAARTCFRRMLCAASPQTLWLFACRGGREGGSGSAACRCYGYCFCCCCLCYF